MSGTARQFAGFFIQRWHRNYPGFFAAFAPWLMALLVGAVADGVTTWQFMAEEGPALELHPIVRLVSHWWGPVLGPIVGKVGQLLAVLLLAVVLRSHARLLLGIATVSYLFAAVYNTWLRDAAWLPF